MVALEGREPVGVLLGAKRPDVDAGVRPARPPGAPPARPRAPPADLAGVRSSPSSDLRGSSPRSPPTAHRPGPLFDACRWRTEEPARRLVSGGIPAYRVGRRSEASFDLPIGPITLDEASESGLLAGPRCWQRDLPALAKQCDRALSLGFHSAGTPRGLPRGATGVRPAGRSWPWRSAPDSAGPTGLAPAPRRARASGGRRAALVLPRAAAGEIDPVLLVELGFRSGARAPALLHRGAGGVGSGPPDPDDANLLTDRRRRRLGVAEQVAELESRDRRAPRRRPPRGRDRLRQGRRRQEHAHPPARRGARGRRASGSASSTPTSTARARPCWAACATCRRSPATRGCCCRARATASQILSRRQPARRRRGAHLARAPRAAHSHVWRATREFAKLAELLAAVALGRRSTCCSSTCRPARAHRAVRRASSARRPRVLLVTIPSALSRGVVARSVDAPARRCPTGCSATSRT